MHAAAQNLFRNLRRSKTVAAIVTGMRSWAVNRIPCVHACSINFADLDFVLRFVDVSNALRSISTPSSSSSTFSTNRRSHTRGNCFRCKWNSRVFLRSPQKYHHDDVVDIMSRRQSNNNNNLFSNDGQQRQQYSPNTINVNKRFEVQREYAYLALIIYSDVDYT